MSESRNIARTAVKMHLPLLNAIPLTSTFALSVRLRRTINTSGSQANHHCLREFVFWSPGYSKIEQLVYVLSRMEKLGDDSRGCINYIRSRTGETRVLLGSGSI